MTTATIWAAEPLAEVVRRATGQNVYRCYQCVKCASGCPLAEAVESVAGPRGVDIAVEAVGKPALVAECASLTRPRGDVLMIGVCPQGSPLPIDLYDFHYREIRLQGAFGRGNDQSHIFQVL